MARSSFRVPFPAAGEGLFLYFNIADLEGLETAYGAGEVLSSCEEFLLNKPSATHITKLLSVGLKYDDGSGKTLLAFPEKVAGAPDELPFPMTDAVEPILNAVSLCMYGKTHKELINDAIERHKQMQQEMQNAEEAKDPFPASEG